MNYIPLLKKQITAQEQAIRNFKLWVFSVLFAGLVLIIFSLIFPGENSLDWFKFGSGIFTGSIAGFPLSQIFTRRERIVTFTEIIVCFEECEGKSVEEREVCDKFATKVIDETIKR
jgi:hypothetical protein